MLQNPPTRHQATDEIGNWLLTKTLQLWAAHLCQSAKFCYRAQRPQHTRGSYPILLKEQVPRCLWSARQNRVLRHVNLNHDVTERITYRIPPACASIEHTYSWDGYRYTRS